MYIATLALIYWAVLFRLPVPDFFEDGIPLPAQAYLKVCSAMSEASLTDLKTSNLPTAPADSPAKEAEQQQSATTVQRTSVLHTEEIVRASKLNQTYSSRWILLTSSSAPLRSPSDQVAGQSHVDQAGDHHGDSEHPSGGQEWQGEKVPYNLRGNETHGHAQTGGSSQNLSASRGRSQRGAAAKMEPRKRKRTEWNFI